jgi:protein O-GlcNAc transferase
VSLDEQGALEDAARLYEAILKIERGHAAALCHLGRIRIQQGKFDEAVDLLRKAINRNPKYAVAHNLLGAAFSSLGRKDKAMLQFQKAARLDPNKALAHANLGSTLLSMGRTDEAIISLRRSVELKSEDPLPRWQLCMAHLPIIYRSEEEIGQRRSDYARELGQLAQDYRAMDRGRLAQAAGVVGASQPFHLTNQGCNDRELQAIYGDMVASIMAARYPQLTERPPMPSLSTSPIRIGILSGFFREHSVWKLYIRGWLAELPRDRFKIFAYYTQGIVDRDTEVARACVSKFTQGPQSFDSWCDAIRADNLHILYIPETGMDPTTLKLAALRLAPVQVVSWGHPNTSGLPTIDYFLSSDFMEAVDAQTHYIEKLVRLPNIGVRYTPLDIPELRLTRADLRLPENGVLYWCCQTLHKYLPQHDWIFPEIARSVPDAWFVFVHHPNRSITAIFRERIHKVFVDRGMDIDRHCRFLERLDVARFSAVGAKSDIFLDNPGWSGCTSTLEALATNLPIATHRGEMMRATHSSAFLEMMGLDDLVTNTVEELVAFAIRLGGDAELRSFLRKRIAENKMRIYEDNTVIPAVEQFIEDAVRTAPT